MVNAKATLTLMSISTRITANGTKKCENSSMYQSIVGALQYLIITRLDIAFNVNKACQFMTKVNGLWDTPNLLARELLSWVKLRRYLQDCR